MNNSYSIKEIKEFIFHYNEFYINVSGNLYGSVSVR